MSQTDGYVAIGFDMRRRWVRLAIMLAVVSTTLATFGCRTTRPVGDRASGSSIKAIWVTRWDYKKPSDIRTIMENCRGAGFNTVLFQVRGNGTAFYRSKLEPWADELGGRDPGFDPLKVACREAHKRGLSIHAWVNVMPGWRGDKPPRNPRQLYHARAHWFWRDEHGRREPLGWYNSLNPCYPEVRRYLVDVMREVVAGYPVDGLHLDYVRFPNEWNDAYARGATVPDYPRDPKTLAMFRSETGRTPDQDPRLWKQWRADKVTQLVDGIRRMMKSVKPRAKLSAAIGSNPERAFNHHFQDVNQWLARGLLDAVYPMNYEGSLRAFNQRLTYWSGLRLPIPVVTGVMFDKRDSNLVIQQLSNARERNGHFAAFAYNSLFERLDAKRRPLTDKQSASRNGLRREVLPHIRTLAARNN